MRVWLRTSARGCSSAFERGCRFAVIVLAASAFGCRRGEQPVVSIQVSDRSGIGVDASESLSPDEVRRLSAKAIERLGSFRVRQAREGEIGWQAAITVQLTADRRARPNDAGAVAEDEVFRQAAVTMDLSQLASDPVMGIRQRFVGSGVVAKNVRLFDGFSELVASAIDRARRDLEIELETAKAADKEVLSRLLHTDPRIQARAIEAAGGRKLVAAVPALLEALGDDEEEPDVVFKVIGALIQIRDPRAVGPLIDSARRRSPMYLGQIIFGVAQIGGREAEAYLFTVASGHPDPEVRAHAQDALEEMKRAAAAKSVKTQKEFPDDG